MDWSTEAASVRRRDSQFMKHEGADSYYCSLSQFISRPNYTFQDVLIRKLLAHKYNRLKLSIQIKCNQNSFLYLNRQHSDSQCIHPYTLTNLISLRKILNSEMKLLFVQRSFKEGVFWFSPTGTHYDLRVLTSLQKNMI